MSVVSNTSPLIALAKVDQLGLLETIFEQVYIPSAVQRELWTGNSQEIQRLDRAFSSFIHIKQVVELQIEVQLATRRLEAGEQEAIALAYQLNLPLIIDDRLGRQAARSLSLPISGVAGVLILAKQQGAIPSVKNLLQEIRNNGYWLSDELIGIAARLAGE
jgi:uncharacterized protein